MEHWQLKQRQCLPLAQKIRLSEVRIKQWYDYWLGNVYIAFSGGKDSTVLLHLVRSLYPDVPAVFSDTGLEYPEIRKFVKTIENVIWIKPEKTFKQIIEKYGYPIISKETSQKIYEVRTTKSEKLKNIRLVGKNNKYHSGRIPLKWQFLINAPFKISHKCCDYLKKKPLLEYEKQTGRLPYIGTMACDSHLRKQRYLRQGCNSFSGKLASHPLSVWQQKNIWDYIKQFNLKYADIYDLGEQHTGCIFCMFGCHLENKPNKFQRLLKTHPKLHNYCINKLGCGKILDYIGVNYN